MNATAVALLEAAGAICVGCLNMDEYAYGFTTENSHHGATHNPHDPTRTAGGSSGGSGAAVAGGLVPITLGTDTNGSIRVPASLNGIFGIKPTYGRLSRAGSVLFVPSLDHIGPFARSTADLAAAYDALQERGSNRSRAGAAPGRDGGADAGRRDQGPCASRGWLGISRATVWPRSRPRPTASHGRSRGKAGPCWARSRWSAQRRRGRQRF